MCEKENEIEYVKEADESCELAKSVDLASTSMKKLTDLWIREYRKDQQDH